MMILDKKHKFNGESLAIPLYHRGHLSIFAGATVWACLFADDKHSKALPELIISPIAYRNWGDIWRINILFWERIGLVHDVLEILRQLKINVITLECSSVNHQKHYFVEIVADMCDYKSRNDLELRERLGKDKHRLRDLENVFFLYMDEDVYVNSNGNPSIKISRVRSLFDYKNETWLDKNNKISPSIIQDIDIVKQNDQKVRISLPDQFKDKLKGYGKYLMVSDTKYRYAKIIFFKNEEKVINPTLTFKEKIGALAEISSVFQRFNFNILACLSRLYRFGDKAQAEFVLQVPPEHYGCNDVEIQAVLEDKLSTNLLIETYQIEIDYRKHFKSEYVSKKLINPTSDIHSVPVDFEYTSKYIESKMDKYAKIVDRPNCSQQESRKYNYIKKLRSMEVSGVTPGNRPMFVSYPLAESGRFQAVLEAGKTGNRFLAQDGALLKGGELYGSIIEKIRTCSHFLGIWTEVNGTKVKEVNGITYYIPSYWLPWELGVAQALGLRWCLLISNRIEESQWKRIVPGITHYCFDPTISNDFDSKLENALQSLL